MTLRTPQPDDIHPAGTEETAAYVVRLPASTPSKLIISTPHSGIWVPDNFQDELDIPLLDVLIRGDRYTDWLTMGAPELGASQIICKVAPAYLNVGRSALSTLPSDVRGDLGDLEWDPKDIYVKDGQGQGIVAVRSLYDDKWMYQPDQHPDAAEIKRRIAEFHTPYHARLRDLVNDAVNAHGKALIFDAHSAPSEGPPTDLDYGQERAELIISNADGKSCDPALVQTLKQIAEQRGFTTGINFPYKGGRITQMYGAHSEEYGPQNCQSVQIEFKRQALGLNERALVLEDPQQFARLQACTQEMLVAMERHIA